MDLPRRHPRQERRRRRHRCCASVANGARYVFAMPRQPWQQRAWLESMRSALIALRPAYAQPQRRCPHLHHCRLRHFRHFISPQPPAARAADPRRTPQRYPRDRTGRRAEFCRDRLCNTAAGRRAAERGAANSRFSAGAGPDRGGRTVAQREPRHAWQRRRHRDPDRPGGHIGGMEWTEIRARTAVPQRLRRFAILDEGIEWAEDQVIYRYGGFTSSKETSHLGEQALLAELAPEEIAALAELSTMRRYEAGQRIISAGEPANSLFFLQSG